MQARRFTIPPRRAQPVDPFFAIAAGGALRLGWPRDGCAARAVVARLHGDRRTHPGRAVHVRLAALELFVVRAVRRAVEALAAVPGALRGGQARLAAVLSGRAGLPHTKARLAVPPNLARHLGHAGGGRVEHGVIPVADRRRFGGASGAKDVVAAAPNVQSVGISQYKIFQSVRIYQYTIFQSAGIFQYEIFSHPGYPSKTMLSQ
jgi:hypothetical protein